MQVARIALLVLALLILGILCYAQEDTSPAQNEPAEEQPEPAPATTPEPAPPADPASLFDPAVAAMLQAQWAATGGSAGGPFSATANATFLSQPSGFDVFMISVSDVRAAENTSSSVTVESLVFNDAHYLGKTPLTVSLPAQDYVLAVRGTQRADGYDGECVIQFTRDPITGGRRYDYHLYPLKKERGSYLCFTANFLSEGFTKESAFELPAGSDNLYSIPEGELISLLAMTSQCDEDRRARLAEDLLEYGVGFYTLERQTYLVKLTLSGTEPVIKEWPVVESQ